MLACQQVLDHLSDYVDNQLSPGELAHFDEHITMCPACADYAMGFLATVAACRSLRPADHRGPHQLAELN